MTGSMYYLKDYSCSGSLNKVETQEKNTHQQVDVCILDHPNPDVEQEFDEMLKNLIQILDDVGIAVESMKQIVLVEEGRKNDFHHFHPTEQYRMLQAVYHKAFLLTMIE